MQFKDKQGTNYGRVYGSGDGQYFGLLDGDGNWSYLASKDDYTQFRVNNSAKMTIKSTGNVGIGTTSPTQKLDVNGKIRMRSQTASSDSADTVATKGYVDNNAGGQCPTGYEWFYEGDTVSCKLDKDWQIDCTCSKNNMTAYDYFYSGTFSTKFDNGKYYTKAVAKRGKRNFTWASCNSGWISGYYANCSDWYYGGGLTGNPGIYAESNFHSSNIGTYVEGDLYYASVTRSGDMTVNDSPVCSCSKSYP